MAGFSLRPDDAEQAPEGIWTPYGPKPTDEEQAAGIVQERYKIRLLAPKYTDEFREAAMKRRWDRHQLVQEPDPEIYNELLYDHMIEDWEGVYEDDDKKHPAPCTKENKVILMKTSLDRQNFIILQGSLYANDDIARKTAQRANFRQADRVPAGLSEPRLQGVSGPS